MPGEVCRRSVESLILRRVLFLTSVPPRRPYEDRVHCQWPFLRFAGFPALLHSSSLNSASWWELSYDFGDSGSCILQVCWPLSW